MLLSETEEQKLPQALAASLVERIRNENMRLARSSHRIRKHFFPASMQPLSAHMLLYNRPTDLPLYSENMRSHADFRPVLMAQLVVKQAKRKEKEASLRKMYHRFKVCAETWPLGDWPENQGAVAIVVGGNILSRAIISIALIIVRLCTAGRLWEENAQG